MATETLPREILNEVSGLNPDQQRQVLGYVRSLKLPASAPGKSLLRFVGSIDADDLKRMSAAIKDGCERVATDEW